MIANSSEYKQYLASREWAVLREKVRERSRNTCERCFVEPQAAVHHKTYERIGCERLEDLQAICTPCHEYISGKRDTDPILKLSEPRRISEMNVIDTGDNILRCPTCGEFNTHAKAVYALKGEDEGENGTLAGLEVRGVAKGWRRSAEVIRFYCEFCPVEFEIIFQQHKGVTFIEVRRCIEETLKGA